MAPTQEPEVHRVFDSDFKEKYSGEKFNYEGKKVVNRTPDGSGNYKDYENSEVKVKERDNEDELTINFGPLGWLFYLILFGAVGYLAYVLLNEGGTGLFTSKRNRSLKQYQDITSENIEHADIHSLIHQAESNKDYRLAIRYYYLLVLKMLSIKNHIKFEDDKTNSEYLNELHEKPFSQAFAYTSYLYNYIWYGKFSLDDSQYQKAKKNFTKLINEVG
ncbi:hypothetical protein H7U19_04315 [Hyunsoonleella sp. SJ7]|uniref:DUF4129 domain-containing protein n=1 Tax=Hyunsoonleella aquatilis TaxID=2762758 RepID=A0A923KK99_9FLAO|nr:hypothetical protein [Hyunsoonleella aquatilis]MBC3757613.1 hypothetical protein [Hyunsoonleella aquatilis]